MQSSLIVFHVLAAGSSGSNGKGSNALVSFLPIILLVVVAYLLFIRPARNRQRKAMENRAALEPGAEVTTTAGLLATVVSVDEDAGTVTLEVAPGVQSRYLKGAIARVHGPDVPEPATDGGLDAPAQESIPDDEPPPTLPEPTALDEEPQEPRTEHKPEN